MANEKRRIDANALIEALKNAKAKMPMMWGVQPFNASLMVKILESRPTVDAVEVVHGRWIVENEASIRCSECCFNRASIKMPLNYCPMCGAKMVR